MNKWIIADTHFSHHNIIAYEKRPFSDIFEMDEAMIRNWNELVKPEDEVYHLGDVAIANSEYIKEVVGRLNGRKYLIRGNHDYSNTVTKWGKLGFEQMLTKTKSREEYYLLETGGIQLALSHYPIEDLAIPNVHGHVHSKNAHLDPEKHFCVSVEHTAYKPLSLEVVIAYFTSKTT